MEEKSIQSMGGEARAKSLSPEERSRIAQVAAATRWNIPRATHQGVLTISKIEIPCFVLENGTRVISQRGIQRSLGMSVGGAAKAGARRLTLFLKQFHDKMPSSNDLTARFNNPLVFQPPHGGRTGFGYEATMLSDICEFILQCRDAKTLNKQQERYAHASDMILRALAKVGIIALVDEATGYQEIRDRLALQKILEKYLLDEYAKWAKRFPDEFYQEMFRLRGWQWNSMSVKRPGIIGKYTNSIVYERLAPGVLDELRKRNPRDEKGNRKVAHHQFLTPDTGVPALDRHLYSVIALMRAASGWAQFERMLTRAFPKCNEQIPLALEE